MLEKKLHTIPEDLQPLWHAVVPPQTSPQRLAYITEAFHLLARLKAVRAEIDGSSLVFVTEKTGVRRLNPLVQLESELRRDFLSLWEKLQLTTTAGDMFAYLNQQPGDEHDK